MEIRAALAEYLEMHEHLSSVYTVKQYSMSLRKFIDWLEERGIRDTGQLTLVHLREWTGYISVAQSAGNHRKKDLDAVTIHFYCLSVKIFCRWLEREEIIDPPITYRWRIPKRPDKHLSALSPTEAQALLEASGKNTYQYRQWASAALVARDQAIVTLLMDSGIRRSEAAGLRLCDINYTEMVLLVTRKGGNEQAVPISEEAMVVLDGYLVHHRPILARGGMRRRTDAVFLTGKGSALSADGVTHLFRRLAKRVAIPGKQVSAHAMRRYMATAQLAMGRDSLHVQRQLGHATLYMTNRYVALSVEQLRASHEAFSPLRAAREAKSVRPQKLYYDEE